VAECAAAIRSQLGDGAPDLALAFVSPHHSELYARVPALVREALGGGILLGCSSGGVIGGGREVEQRSGVALAAAHLPDVVLVPFHLQDQSMPDLDAGPDRWEGIVGVAADRAPQFILLADPFSIRAENLVLGLDYAFASSAKIGGLASGAQQPGGNALFLADGVHRAGAVGIAMHGNVTMQTIVAQGCRPIGEPMRITACQRNILLDLDGRKPMHLLQHLYERLNERDQELMRHSLFLGVVMDELTEHPQQGDFLIRNIVGIDRERGALAIGEMLKEGQTVQFHLRDAHTSAEDLAAVLSRYSSTAGQAHPAGALLFSCVGRGQHLYGRPDHDTEMFHTRMGPVALAGFFCNGEIGPIGGRNFGRGRPPRVDPGSPALRRPNRANHRSVLQCYNIPRISAISVKLS
jgi:small ligand-binding sensory domain FIST